jgi:hypothetical protein
VLVLLVAVAALVGGEDHSGIDRVRGSLVVGLDGGWRRFVGSPRLREAAAMRRRMSMALGNSDEKDAARMATLFNPNKPAVKVKGGWMDKAGEKNTAWKRRWFELVDHDTLTYTSEPGGKPKGAIDLHLCQRVRANPESPLLLEVASAERQFQLRCDTEKERQDWLGVLYAATRALHVRWLPSP